MPAAKQPFPLPLTDEGGIGFLSLFLKNRCNCSNNPQTKSKCLHPVSAADLIRQIPPEGRSQFSSPPATLMLVPYKDLFAAFLNIWLISYTDLVTPLCHLIPATVLASPFPKAALWQLGDGTSSLPTSPTRDVSFYPI